MTAVQGRRLRRGRIGQWFLVLRNGGRSGLRFRHRSGLAIGSGGGVVGIVVVGVVGNGVEIVQDVGGIKALAQQVGAALAGDGETWVLRVEQQLAGQTRGRRRSLR